jgi:hypothetical protein
MADVQVTIWFRRKASVHPAAEPAGLVVLIDHGMDEIGRNIVVIGHLILRSLVNRTILTALLVLANHISVQFGLSKVLAEKVFMMTMAVSVDGAKRFVTQVLVKTRRLKAISIQCGYVAPSSFSRLFKFMH